MGQKSRTHNAPRCERAPLRSRDMMTTYADNRNLRIGVSNDPGQEGKAQVM